LEKTIVIIIAVLAIAIGIAVALLVLPKPYTPPPCPAKDNSFFVVYLDIPPNEEAFKQVADAISYVIAVNSSNTINITFSVCSIKYSELEKELQTLLKNYTTFPIMGVHTSKDLSKVAVAQQLFDFYGNYYVVKEGFAWRISAILPYYGYTIFKEGGIVAEIAKAPKVFINETPVIGSLNSKYYLVIYEDAHCPACARFYAETLPVIERLVENNTFAIVLKNFIVHEEVLPMHRNITAMYLVTRNATAVLEVMKSIYKLMNLGITPPADYVASLVRNVTGYSFFNVTREVIDKVIEEDFEEGLSYRVTGTPGLLIWSRERNKGVVIVGHISAENLLSIARRYLS
jgi:protein-disulfide isomerase